MPISANSIRLSVLQVYRILLALHVPACTCEVCAMRNAEQNNLILTGVGTEHRLGHADVEPAELGLGLGLGLQNGTGTDTNGDSHSDSVTHDLDTTEVSH